MQEEKEYRFPIAEWFTSQQGEGEFSGVVMSFVRLAGCTIGEPYKEEEKQKVADTYFAGYTVGSWGQNTPNPLHSYTEKCTLWSGVSFPCDTNYKMNLGRMTAKEIAAKLDKNVKHACITGGEPMMHPLLPLIDEIHKLDIEVHIETSGTIPLEKIFPRPTTHLGIWITCSPKLGVLAAVAARADEIKLLVDENFDPSQLIPEIASHRRLYLQPINTEREISVPNLLLCMEWQKKNPKYRLSLQLHKVLETITGNRVL